MDLPTYTSIWRIEKRLYKLYDFRLPMPVPVGQITVFAAMTLPYVVLLTMLGVPFNHTLIWLYVLPPGALTWLVTRPVLESKRLPELIRSQLRYLTEPRVWCRMSALAERDVVMVSGRVWRLPGGRRPQETRPGTPSPARSARPGARGRGRPAGPIGFGRPGTAGTPGSSGRPHVPARLATRVAEWRSAEDDGGAPVRPAARRPGRPARAPAGRPARQPAAGPVAPQPVRSEPPPLTRQPLTRQPLTRQPLTRQPLTRSQAAVRPGGPPPLRPSSPGTTTGPGGAAVPVRAGSVARPVRPGRAATTPPVTPEPVTPEPVTPGSAKLAPAKPGARDHGRPAVTVVAAGSPTALAPTVERALAGPRARRADGRAGRVTVVPGGHRPGKPDQLHRDRARAQLPVESPSLVIVLGCTVGAGQTVTTLLTGEVLASLRTDRIAVLDLNPGASSLAVRARARPALSQAASLGPSRLVVLGAEWREPGRDDPDPGEFDRNESPETAADRDPAGDAEDFMLAGERYDFVLADPSTSSMPRLLPLADQVVLVAPASSTAASAIGMTFEWLEAHGQAGLAAGAIMVLNGVSRRSMTHVEHAERLCVGRCRAIVRVPWDDQLTGRPAGKRVTQAAPGSAAGQHWAGLLSPATVGAYTALAGVLVTALAQRSPELR